MQRIPISPHHIRFFHRHGFVVLDHSPLINPKSPAGAKLLLALQQSFHRCFEESKFNYYGNYPDEWHWRKGISKEHPGIVREICNGWKADRTIRQVVLSQEVGEIGGQLMQHWRGSRVAQDDMVWKIPNPGVFGETRSRSGSQDDMVQKIPNRGVIGETRSMESSDSESEDSDTNSTNIDTQIQQQRITTLGSQSQSGTSDSESYVGYHIDSSYISDQFRKKPGLDSNNTSVTVWIALDDTDSQNGGLEYVCGSHKVMADMTNSMSNESDSDNELSELMSFHNSTNPEVAKQKLVETVRAKIKKQSISDQQQYSESDNDSDSIPHPEPGSIYQTKIPLGHCVVHHQNTLHGSGPNVCPKLRHRRALVVHLLQGDTDGGVGELEFKDNPGYIYGRYKLNNSNKVLEDFFPVTWRRK